MLVGNYQTTAESNLWFDENMPDYPPHIAIKAWLALESGDRQTGLDLVDRFAELCRIRTAPNSMHMAWMLMKLMRLSGDLKHIELAEQKSVADIATTKYPVALKFVWITSSAILSVLRKDKNEARRFYDLLLPHRGTAEPGFWGLPVTVDRILGNLATVLGDREAAIAHFKDSIVFCRKGRFGPELAHVCNDYASLLLADPGMAEPSNIVVLIDEGAQLTTDLEMAELKTRFEHLRSRLNSQVRSNAFRPAGLTRRELEVLQLLAQGHSNQKLASVLSISEHTVFTHVSRILSKTESSSRAQAIAYAHKSGIA